MLPPKARLTLRGNYQSTKRTGSAATALPPGSKSTSLFRPLPVWNSAGGAVDFAWQYTAAIHWAISSRARLGPCWLRGTNPVLSHRRNWSGFDRVHVTDGIRRTGLGRPLQRRRTQSSGYLGSFQQPVDGGQHLGFLTAAKQSVSDSPGCCEGHSAVSTSGICLRGPVPRLFRGRPREDTPASPYLSPPGEFLQTRHHGTSRFRASPERMTSTQRGC